MPMRIVVHSPALTDQIRALAQTDKVVRREVLKGLGKGLKIVRSAVVPRIPRWSGQTVRGFRSKVRQRDGYWTGRFYNQHPFWLRMVQEGRGAGRAPWTLPERLVAWVAQKSGATGSDLRQHLGRVLRYLERTGTQQAQGDIMGEAAEQTRPAVVEAFHAGCEAVVRHLAMRGKR